MRHRDMASIYEMPIEPPPKESSPEEDDADDFYFSSNDDDDSPSVNDSRIEVNEEPIADKKMFTIEKAYTRYEWALNFLDQSRWDAEMDSSTV